MAPGYQKAFRVGKAQCSQAKISAAIFRKDTPADQVTAAEIFFSMFIAEHNLPFLAADHFNKLCKVMCLGCQNTRVPRPLGREWQGCCS